MHPDLSGPSFVDALDTARSALNPFALNYKKAKKQGYVNTETHVYEDNAIYGAAFVDEDVSEIRLERPPILLYRMTPNWVYELLGAEWYVPAADVDEPPTLFGREFHEPLAGHSPKTDQPEHYGLHAWLFRANPEGMFALYNPRYEKQ